MWRSIVLSTLGFTIIYFLHQNTIFVVTITLSLIILIIKKSLPIIILSLLSSVILIFIIAVIDLNFLSLRPYSVFIDINEINRVLLANRTAPKIIAIDKKAKLVTYELAKVGSGTQNLFGKHILNLIPPGLIFSPQSRQPDFILIDDKLIISQISPDQIKVISPTLGYLFVQNYFTQLPIKSFPKVDLLSDEEYKKFRRDDFLDKLKLVDVYLQASQNSIATLSATQKKLESQIVNLQAQVDIIYKDLNRGAKNRDAKYNQVSQINQQIDEAKAELKSTETSIADTQNLIQFFQSQKQLGEKLIGNIPSERGAFYPPDQIKLSLPDSNPHTIADYLSNLVHEYLHYASYKDNDHKLNNPFFEEGLTEFYSRKIINRHLNIQTNLGYPVLNIIFEKLAQNLPDSDLLEIYFTKNEPALIALINRVYGKNFYQQNANLFLAIQSTNDRQKLLPLANLLMSKIKGPSLTEQDLISTFSKY